MTLHQCLMKASQDDAKRAGERDRLFLEVRRAQITPRRRAPRRPGKAHRPAVVPPGDGVGL
jgi:hypothetical protein